MAAEIIGRSLVRAEATGEAVGTGHEGAEGPQRALVAAVAFFLVAKAMRGILPVIYLVIAC